MTQPTSAQSKFVDSSNNPMINDRQAAIVALTDSTGGTGTDTLTAVSGSGADATINNNLASLRDKIDEIIEVLELHGLIADN